jgi:hypothetical protein
MGVFGGIPRGNRKKHLASTKGATYGAGAGVKKKKNCND